MMKKHYLFLLTILSLGSFIAVAQDNPVVDCDPLGCMDETACNYDADATEDDGSCTYPVVDENSPLPGFMLNCDGLCMDADENGVCDYNQVGCTDADACNYTEFCVEYECLAVDGDECVEYGPTCIVVAGATEDDGSCEYAQLDFDCDGACIDLDEDGICDKVDDLICASMDDDGNWVAGVDSDNDGFCDDAEVFSECADETACNYVVGSSQTYNVTVDADSGEILSVVTSNPDIELAEGYMPIDANNDGEYGCIYPPANFDCDLQCTDSDDDGSCDFTADGVVIDNCTDTDAWNYMDVTAEECCMVAGCTDEDSFNYNPDACFDDSSCESIIYGCMDELACNYSQLANVDVGDVAPVNEFGAALEAYAAAFPTGELECGYPAVNADCNGECIDEDEDGVCDFAEVEGCTDPTAVNYNSSATGWNCDDEDEDGVLDCCEPVTEGCQDNFFADGTPIGNFCGDCNTECDDADGDGVGDCCEVVINGCMDEEACNWEPTANSGNQVEECDYAIPGFYCDGSCIDLDDDGSCDVVDDCVGEFNDCDDCMELEGTCEGDDCYVMGTCNGECVEGDDDGDGVCNDYEIPGCNVPAAVNYNEDATDNDGSCYNFDINGEASTCDTDWDEETGTYVSGDADGDGVCDEDEVLGCTDEMACNYDEDAGATEDDGSCQMPADGYNCNGTCVDIDGAGWTAEDANGAGDGICDVVDDCVGILDACGVCNGDDADLYYVCLGDDPNTEEDETGVQTCINDTDGDGICNELEIPGCTDDGFCNYDMNATENDGSCEGVVGCDLQAASNGIGMSNYSPIDPDCEGADCVTCIVNDSCIPYVPGCYDQGACNYDGVLNCEGDDCPEEEIAGWIDDGSCETESCTGCMDELACNYDETMSISDEDMCNYAADVPGDYDGDEACAYYELDTDGDGVLDYMEVDGCTNSEACNYNADATEDDGSCEDDCDTCNYDDEGNFVDMTNGDADENGTCDDSEIPGCTDVTACNYNENATQDNNSCVGVVSCTIPNNFNTNLNYDAAVDCEDNSICEAFYQGCMDDGDQDWSPNPGVQACNYDTLANTNYNCIYPINEYVDCDGNCLNDCDGDGACDEDENWGCTDVEACNTAYFDADGDFAGNEPTSEDGSIVYTIATQDDGSCTPYGCGQIWAYNYSQEAVDAGCEDNTLCIEWVVGCADQFACNFDPNVTQADAAACEYPINGSITNVACDYCELNDDGEWEVFTLDNEDCGGADLMGCMDLDACNFNEDATVSNDDMCEYPTDACSTADVPSGTWNDDCECIPVGIEEVTASFGLLIYPNPADSYITIELDSYDYEDARIMIINQLGQVVDTHTTSTFSTTNIDVSNYPTGLYQVSVATDKDVVNKSILIK
jgi:hypothetical protein